MDSANPRYPLLADEEGWRKLVTDAVEAVDDIFAQRGATLSHIQKHTLNKLIWAMLSDILIGDTQ